MKHSLDAEPKPSAGVLMILTLGLGLVGGVALDRIAAAGLGTIDAADSFRLMSQAWQTIQRFYVDRAAAQPHTMTYGAISGMVDALGDTGHSRFLSPAMVKALGNQERNQFQGIGVEIQLKAGHVTIVAPIDDSPAQRAGLRPGDIILRVDGQEVTGLPLDQVVEKISGPPGAPVTLTILDSSSGHTRELLLKRAAIKIHNITWHVLPGTRIVHLRIASFGKGVTEDLHKALTEINKSDAESIVLDLRNNPGGLLDEAVGTASQFLNEGNVLLVQDARGRRKPIPVKPGGAAAKIPLVALVNEGTASGAEIMAGALQDAHRARLVGETTIGTGTVLNEFKLSDGSALLLATEEWLTPAGHLIWHKGIKPDVLVELPAEVFPAFPESERALSADQLRVSRDTQLLRALTLLQQADSKPE